MPWPLENQSDCAAVSLWFLGWELFTMCSLPSFSMRLCDRSWCKEWLNPLLNASHMSYMSKCCANGVKYVCKALLRTQQCAPGRGTGLVPCHLFAFE